MNHIRAAMVEDDPQHTNLWQDFLSRYGQEKGLEITAEQFSNGMDFVSDYTPKYDMIFMDIEMPYMNGMDCAFKLRELDPDVILVFVTSMVQYAVKGYEVGAVGYMVKPLRYFPFSVLMDKVMGMLSARETLDVYINSGSHVKRISSRDLYYIEVRDHYLIFHTTEGDFTQNGKMKDIEAQLDRVDFFRCSNCYLVNLRHVKEISDNDITVGKDTIQISRRRKKEFMEAINAYFKKGG